MMDSVLSCGGIGSKRYTRICFCYHTFGAISCATFHHSERSNVRWIDRYRLPMTSCKSNSARKQFTVPLTHTSLNSPSFNGNNSLAEKNSSSVFSPPQYLFCSAVNVDSSEIPSSSITHVIPSIWTSTTLTNTSHKLTKKSVRERSCHHAILFIGSARDVMLCTMYTMWLKNIVIEKYEAIKIRIDWNNTQTIHCDFTILINLMLCYIRVC